MAAAALAALGCSHDEFADSAMKGNTTIVASFETAGSNTRTSVNENSQVVWNKDDAFGLFYTNDQTSSPAVTPFTTTTADGTSTSASFTGTLDDNVTTSYAVYPYQEGMSLNGTTVTTTLPVTFTYTTTSNGPMYAPASNYTNGVAFKHLAGLLKLTISKGITNQAKKFVITADKAIAGTATADLSETDPTLAVEDNSSNSKTITVNLDVTATTDQATTFYIPIPVGTYATLSAKLLGEGDAEITTAKEWKNISVARAGMLTSSFGFIIITASTSSSNEAIKEAINNAIPESPTTETTTEVQITGTIDATSNSGINNIAIPVTTNSNVSLSLAAVPTTASEKPLTLSDATNTTATPANTSTNTVTVAIPKVENGTTAPAINIAMPSSTVVLDATGTEGTTYGTVTATTANNTLVIKEKVTVTKLIVAGGNVRVAGTITELSKDGNLTDTPYLIKEEGASIPENTEGFTVIDAATYDMMQVAKNGGTYVLSSDVILSEPLVVESTMTLDLNGHSIKPKADGLNKILNTKDGLVLVRRGANLTINDSTNGTGSIDTKNVTSVSAAVKLTDSNDEGEALAELTVNGGTIKGEYYGIIGNGTRHGTNITINGGTIESTCAIDGTGIYHPQDGTLTVTGGTICGYNAGIEIRSGKLTVEGGVIRCMRTPTEFSQAANANGTTISGAALAVSQHVTDKDLAVTIKDGTLQGGKYALYEKDLQNTNVGNISLKMTGGYLDGMVFTKNSKDFIEGGTLSTPSALNELAANANVKVKLNADMGVSNIKVESGQTVEVDLNSKTLTLKSNIANDIYGRATFSNGTIKQAAGNLGALYARENGELTIDNVKVSGANYALYAQGPNVKLNVINGSEIHAKYFPVSTNANTNDDGTLTYGQNAIITLSDSKFIGTETGFMNNVPAVVTITNCEFSGNHQAALLRGGEYTIKDSQFTLNAELESSHEENKHLTDWSEGNQAAFAGLTIGNYRSAAYQYYTKVSMTGVTVTVSGTYAASYPAMHVCANADTEKGVTMSYDSNSTFTSTYDPAIEYGTTNITVNSQSVVESNGKFIVQQ